MPNIELMRNTLAYIEAHPESWNQADYRRCFAAHATQQAGARFVHDEDAHTDDGDRPLGYWNVAHPDHDLTPTAVWTYAKDLLGIDSPFPLFDASNTVEDLREMIERYAAQAVSA